MKPLPDLFDRKAALDARDAALAQVEGAADKNWMARAEDLVKRLSSIGPFTTDLMWASIEHPDEPRALGAVMMGLRRRGVIRPTGRWVKSVRAACHSRELREWERVP